jgi:hypothetical protein
MEADKMSTDACTAGLADELACYRVEVAPIHRCLRQLLVQLAGVAILAQNQQGTHWPDHPTLAVARTRLKETLDQITAVRVPNAVSHFHPFLGSCAIDLQWVVERMLDIGEKSLDGLNGSKIARRLDRAYRALQNTSNEELGLAVVDMRQACCCLMPQCGGPETHAMQTNH